eukprot:3938596-Rhodomonas_salina.2
MQTVNKAHQMHILQIKLLYILTICLWVAVATGNSIKPCDSKNDTDTQPSVFDTSTSHSNRLNHNV